MELIRAVVYGLIQGLTEFLPISSSGHVFLPETFFGWSDPGAGFTAVIQLGTLLAVLIYFWKDIVTTAVGFFGGLARKELRQEPSFQLGLGMLVGTIPVMVVGLGLEEAIDTTFRSAWIVAGALAGFGLLMGVADRFGKREKPVEALRVKDLFVMGLWQCLALIPGSSRSGSTITGALFGGFDRTAAAKGSFMLSIPSILGSGLYKLYKERHDLLGAGAVPTLIATVVAFLSGWVAIAWLMRLLRERGLTVFVVYRLVLAGVIVVLLVSQAGR